MTTATLDGSFVRENFARISSRLSGRFRRSMRGSTRRTYDQVNDVHDTRVPIYNEDAFQYGILFKAKFIGSLEISRPSSKLDIITAMRRIRYEFKVKGIKKIRCHIYMSLEGAKVTRRKRNRRRKRYTDDQLFIMQHPIYRIFYVSHDSQDQRIFSYITRESPSNTFRCNVFKAKKKSLALHIVRTLGQAFDVCHKMNPRPTAVKDVTTEGATAEVKETDIDAVGDEDVGEELQSGAKMTDLDAAVAEQEQGGAGSGEGNLISFPVKFDGDEDAGFNWAANLGRGEKQGNGLSEGMLLTSNPFSAGDTESWEAERQQFYGQIQVLQKQLWEETSARIEAQTRVEHLLKQNKELMEHMQKLLEKAPPTQAGPTSPQAASPIPPTAQEPQPDLMAQSFVEALAMKTGQHVSITTSDEHSSDIRKLIEDDEEGKMTAADIFDPLSGGPEAAKTAAELTVGSD